MEIFGWIVLLGFTLYLSVNLVGVIIFAIGMSGMNQLSDKIASLFYLGIICLLWYLAYINIPFEVVLK